MWNDQLEQILQEQLETYEGLGVLVNGERLRIVAKKTAKTALSRYSKLKKPKACTANVYVLLYTKEALSRWFYIKNSREVETSSIKSKDSRVFANFNDIFPLALIPYLNSEMRRNTPSANEKFWKEFKFNIGEIEKRFTAITVYRNKIAVSQGHESYVEMWLKNYKIPKTEYELFIKDIDTIINYSQKQLPAVKLPDWFYSEFSRPCFMCRLPLFPFDSLDKTFEYIASRTPAINKYRSKISIRRKKSSVSKAGYRTKNDTFVVTINKDQNLKHQCVDLIHEIGHTHYFIELFKKNLMPSDVGQYNNEKKAYEFEMKITKSISGDLYKSIFSDFLLQFRQTLFEIELYRNPNQNLSQLYAKTFNKCFAGAKQKSNPLYLLEESIVAKPLSTLPHAIAQASLVRKLISKNA